MTETTALEPIPRTCPICGGRFVISPDEQVFFRELAARKGEAWSLPKRCTACRAARRHAREALTHARTADIPLTCIQCGDPFFFRAVDQGFYLAAGFAQPKRCPPCRTRKGSV
jgi:rubrerythrin